ncbi:hypothetical protein EW145_g7928 [Phellinidium pouzarii]|uniref:Uncharacterized protein n=1 Tax=Phellinidium pouzarii TaxID=167371 RepID=A0A4S4KC67_9AGAM|nr:hypothetical protein EW145_g7928 [Phellinidium pouzarii]
MNQTYPQPPLPSARRRVLMHHGVIYVAYNADHIPNPPLPHTADFLNSNVLPSVSWASNLRPYMGWAPQNPSFTGTVLGRLEAHTCDKVEAKGNQGYVLASEVTASWIGLECSLRALISSLLGLLPHNSRTFPLDMENPRLPSSFGFAKSHPSPGHVCNAARRSRNAFIPVMAYATYLIMRLRRVAQENGWYEDRWARQLEEMEQFPPAWIQEVCLSQIVDMDTPRNGVFVRLSSCQFLKDVRTFINFGMPVWFVWDPMQQNTPHKWANLIRPTTEELTNISMLTADTPMDISSAWGNPNPPTETVSASKPRKLNGASQYEDETWQEFFAHRAEVPVSRASVKDIWDNYRASQKHYDGFCDEWDLCNEFDPTPWNYGPPTDEFDKDDDNWDAPAVTGQTFDNGLDALGPNKIVEDLCQQTGLLLENPSTQDEDGHAVSAGSSMVNPSSDSSTWKKTAKLLFVSVSEVDNVQKPLQEELIAFTQDVINSDRSLAKLHTCMHDLHFNSMAVSPHQRNTNFDIQVLTQRLYTKEPASQGSTSCARRSLTETTIYVLRPRIHSVPWLVAVLDPVAALQWL